jgi:RNase P/RNase MRP subunit p30
MERWDIVKPVYNEEIEKMYNFGKRLGWSEICFLFSKPEDAKGIKYPKGLIITESNLDKIRDCVKKFRKNFEIIALASNSIKLSRAALKISGIDLLISEKIDSGLVKLLNNAGINLLIDFVSLIHTEGESRIKTWQARKRWADILKKTKNFIICSGAHTLWDMRSPSELIAFGRLLGFFDPDIKKAISGWLVKRNIQRMKSDWIMPGVSIQPLVL